MPIEERFVCICDTCSATFEDNTDYDSQPDLVHDLKVSGWEQQDNGDWMCRKCIRRADDDRSYQGPIPNPPPPGF